MLKVSCALILKNDKILVAQLGEASVHPFQWEFPGGKVKQGETAEECIRREIMEELEVQIELIQALKPVIHDYGFRKIELIPFLCRIKSGQMKLKEHAATEWVSLKNMQTKVLSEADRKLILLPENKKILEKYLGK